MSTDGKDMIFGVIIAIMVLIISAYPAFSRWKRLPEKQDSIALIERSLKSQGFGGLDRTKKYEINHQKKTIVIKEKTDVKD